MLVLLVEDDLDLAELIIEFLEGEAFEGQKIECDIAYNGVMGLQLIGCNQYDVVIMDVMMPRMDGMTLCSKIREQDINVPCMMLTARDTLEDKLEGFSKGADDYLVKPFELKELSARIKVLHKRHSNQAPILQVADLKLNTTTRQAQRGKQALTLGPLEWKLLESLMRKSPRVIARSKLESILWPDEEPSKDALKMQVYRLRQIVDGEIDGKRQLKLIHTVRGAGISIRQEEQKS